MLEAFLAIVFLFFSLIIRLAPIWNNRFQGCDAYYFLLYKEYIRKQKRLLPTFSDYFLLEESKQSYPPGFAMILAFMPKKIVEKFYWLISPLIDSIILVIGVVAIYLITNSILITALFGTAYSFSYSAIRETASMTSRQLGTLLLSFSIISFFVFRVYDDILILFISVLFAFILLMTHKLSFQSLWFVLPFISFVTKDFIYLSFLISIVILTLILSFGQYKNILHEHFDILKFWFRNNKNLHAHQVYESPIYGKKDWKRKKERYPRNFLKLCYIYTRRFIIYNPFILLAIGVPFFIKLSELNYLIYLWVFATYVFAFLTVIIPKMRFLGEGEKYLKLVTVPTIYLSVLPLMVQHINQMLYLTFWLVLLVVSCAEYFYEFKNSRKTVNLSSSKEKLEKVFKAIHEKKINRIISIPNSYADSIAYHCRISVLWGGHNLPMVKLLEDFYPIIKKPLSFFKKTYKTDYLLLDTNYCLAEDLNLRAQDLIFKENEFEIYTI